MEKKRNSLFNNFIYNALYNSMNIIFPIITIPYISRILLADGLGKVNYACNIVAWFLLFASLGIPRYGVRAIAKVRGNSSLFNKTANELIFINFISSVISSIIYISMIWVVPYFKGKVILYLVVGVQLFLNVFNVDWFYQGLEEYNYIMKRSFVTKIISLVLMFVFVKSHDDYIIYALIQSLALVGNYLWNFINLKKYIRISLHGLNLRNHLNPIFILLSTQLAVNIYSLLDTTMLGIWCSDSEIGYYGNVHKLIKIIAVLTASLGSVMFPRLVKMHTENDIVGLKTLSEKTLEIIIVMSLPITIGLCLISKDIVPLFFGEDFLPCIKTLKIFAPFVLFTTLGNLFGTQLLMVLGNEKKLLISVIVGAIINFTLNSLLIKYYGQDGAAFASVITEFIVMVVQIVIVEKELTIQLGLKSLIQIFLMNASMASVVLIIHLLSISSLFVTLMLSILLGGVIYGIIGLLLKNEALILLMDILKSRIYKLK